MTALPPLPEPQAHIRFYAGGWRVPLPSWKFPAPFDKDTDVPLYTADQMHEYARAALRERALQNLADENRRLGLCDDSKEG